MINPDLSGKKTNLVLGFMLTMLLAFTTTLFAQNNCLDFDAANDFAGRSLPVTTVTDNFTITAWIKADAIPADQWRCIAYNGTDAGGYGIGLNNGKLGGLYGSIAFLTTGISLETGEWYHIAMRRSSGNTQFFLNGILLSYLYTDHAPLTPVNRFTIGNMFDSDNTGLYISSFDGQIDEVTVWDIALTETQIRSNMYKELAGSETNLKAYYKFNQTSGTDLPDATSNDYDCTLTNMSNDDWVTSSAFFGPKNCLIFSSADGTDDPGDDPDYVYCGSMDLSGSALTLECWVNVDVFQTSSSSYISSLIGSESDGNSAFLRLGDADISAGNKVELVLYIGSAQAQLTSTSTLEINKWYHIAGVYDSESGMKIYINGKLDASNDQSGSFVSNINFYIASNDGLGRYLDGSIDEVRVWKVARTESQIRNAMCSTLEGDEDNLFAFYNFDNTSGDDLQDFSGEDNDGTLQNMTDDDWVASSAYNTWLNTNSSAWSTTTNWSRGSAPGSTDNVGISDYSGGTPPTLSATTVNHFVVDDVFTLGANATVNGNLILEENLDLNGQTVTLGTSANLVESSGYLYGTSGTITTIRMLDGSSTQINEDVAGLGAEITTSANMGSTTIIRGHAAQGTQGIERYYRINPTTNTGLSATLVFNYLDSELNGLTEANLKLFKSPAGNSWTEQSSSVNTGNNTLTLSEIDGFSYWTAAEEGSGATLPVTLSSFTVQYLNESPLINWTTQSETDNAGWNIYRGETSEALSNEEAYLLNLSLGLIPGAGTTSLPTEYSFEDVFPIYLGTTYFYWLESVDYSGETEIHGPISLTIPENEGQNPNSPEIPKPYGLHQNYPNPFNPNTEISFMMQESCIGELSIFNIKGQKIKTIFSNESIPRDELIIYNWNGIDETGKEVSTGVYYYKLRTTKADFVRKMILLK